MRDTIFVVVLVLALAVLLTAHVTIAAGLLRRRPRWRAPVAFVVAPLAPLFAWRAQMRIRAGIWAGSAAAYLATLAIAYAGS